MSTSAKVIAITGIFLSICGSVFGLSEQNLVKSVYKLKIYKLESISGNYTFTGWGSAVVMDQNHVITNAHVVIDSDSGQPTETYELCRSDEGGTPICFSTAKLISYDTVADLAYLEITHPVA